VRGPQLHLAAWARLDHHHDGDVVVVLGQQAAAPGHLVPGAGGDDQP
jgi:hypothetical protein